MSCLVRSAVSVGLPVRVKLASSRKYKRTLQDPSSSLPEVNEEIPYIWPIYMHKCITGPCSIALSIHTLEEGDANICGFVGKGALNASVKRRQQCFSWNIAMI